MSAEGYKEKGSQSFFPVDPSLIGKSETEDDVARDIVLLSTILTNVRHGESTTSSRSHNTPETWSHIAFILTTGDEHDQHGNKAVAVTGRVEPGRIVAAVVARSDVSLQFGKRGGSPVDVVKSLHSSPQQTISMLKRGSYKNTVNFDDHFRDVSSIVSVLLIPLPSDDPEAADRRHAVRTILVFEFIIRRCWRKLRARVEMGGNIWGEHPLLTISNYYRDPSKQRPSVQSFSFVLPSGPYDIILRANGITADANDQDTSTYTLSDTTVHAWAEFLRACYHQMVTTYDALAMNQVLSRDAIEDFMYYLEGLRRALKAGVIARMINFELGRSLDESYERGTKKMYTSELEAWVKLQPQEAKDTTQTSENVCDADQDLHEDLRAKDEDIVRHVSRHLNSLVNPYHAMKALVSYGQTLSHLSPTFDSYMIRVTPDPPAIDEAYFDKFKGKFSELYPSSTDKRANAERALKTLKQKFNKPNPSVHAEAALMALAAGGWMNVEGLEAKQKLGEVFEGENVAVGVSKRCCYCCRLLADLLEKDKTGAKKEFVLHGSHGAIYPWLPPPDVPLEVLFEIRHNLLRALCHVIYTSSGDVLSAQTSPARSDGDLSSGRSRTVRRPDIDLDLSW